MIAAIFLIFLLLGISQVFFNNLEKKHGFFSRKLMNALVFYHQLFFVVYYTYAQFNRSDSRKYYERPLTSNMDWGDHFGTSTTFIDFLSYPFVNYLSFNYEMMMVLFAWM